MNAIPDISEREIQLELQGYADYLRERALSLSAQGLSPCDISSTINVHEQQVRRWLTPAAAR